MGERVEQQHVLGVHGIRQGKTSQRELLKDWREALERGIGRLNDGAAASLSVPALDVPHWSSLLDEDAGRLSTTEILPDDTTPFTAHEEAFVSQALDDLLTPQDRAWAAQADPTTLGVPKLWPASVTRRAMAYDRRKPGGLVSKLVGALREVHTYLTEPTLAGQVRKHVLESASDRTTVLIGHSLGSVIGYDLIRHEELATPHTAGAALRTFVTCGSPLGIPTVRRGMAIPDDGSMAMPPHIRWINVFDPGDVVTGGTGLASGAHNVTDIAVNNGRIDPHAATRYLRTEPVARAVTGRWS